jgi:hypothetical protein
VHTNVGGEGSEAILAGRPFGRGPDSSHIVEYCQTIAMQFGRVTQAPCILLFTQESSLLSNYPTWLQGMFHSRGLRVKYSTEHLGSAKAARGQADGWCIAGLTGCPVWVVFVYVGSVPAQPTDVVKLETG